MNFILDIKLYIAKINEDVWIKMLIIDDEFKEFSYSTIGIKLFEEYFIVKNEDSNVIKYTLLNKFHNKDDLPSIIYKNKLHIEWFKLGMNYRINDLPSIITEYNKLWFDNGIINRKNNLHSIETIDKKIWCFDKKYHRENNLPAVIYNNGKKEWWYNGIRYCIYDGTHYIETYKF